MKAVSHYTSGMIQHLYARCGVEITRSGIAYLMGRNRKLEAEVHEGHKLVDSDKVIAYLDSRIAKDRKQ